MHTCFLVSFIVLSSTHSAVGEQFTVHFSSINATVQLEPDCVQPLESSDESDLSSSDSSSDAEDDDDSGRILGWIPKEHLKHPLAEWEKHTTVRVFCLFYNLLNSL